MGTHPQPPPPRRGRQPTRDEHSSPEESEGYSDTSSHQPDVQRSDESPEGHHPPRIVVTQSLRGRATVPPQPQFYEAVYMAGVRAGAGIRPSQPIQVLSDGDESTPREVNQPQGEPEPEMPGGTEPSESDRTSRTNEGEIDDQDDEDESPDHTDTDVEQTADTEQITIVDSLDESPAGGEAMINPEPASTSQETLPAATTEVASGVSQETISTDESIPKASIPPRPMGRIDAFTSSKEDWFNPLKNPIKPLTATTPEKKQAPADSQEGQTPETQSQGTTNEGAPPQATESEPAPSQPAEGDTSTPQPVEGGSASASTSAAAPAETAASSAQEGPTSDPVINIEPKAESVAPPASVPQSLMQTLGRRRKPISQPPQETAEENEQREERERIAEAAAKRNAAELVDQEQREKKRLSEKEAKSKQAAASNTERAREAAEKARKEKADVLSGASPA